MHKDSNSTEGPGGTGPEEGFSVEQGRAPTLTYTIHQDWCDLMPISHGAARMHRILRSMMVENRGSARPTRHLTMDRLAWIMSSFQKKPVGEQTIRDYRRELIDAGMLDVVPGGTQSSPPRYVVHDLPPEGWSGWSNAWEVDDSYTPEWRSQKPSPSKPSQTPPRTTGGSREQQGHFTPRFTGPPGTPGGPPGTPWSPRVPTRAFGAPKEACKESLSPAASYDASRAARGESERTPAGPTTAPRMREPREAAEAATKRLRGSFGGKIREDIVNGLTAAIQKGLPPSRAVACLNGMLGQGVHSPGRVHRANLEALVDPDEPDMEQWLREMCTGCNERGETTVEEFAVRPGSSVCLHGQEPAREEMATKTCISCPRVIPMRAADRCGRCVRTAA